MGAAVLPRLIARALLPAVLLATLALAFPLAGAAGAAAVEPGMPTGAPAATAKLVTTPHTRPSGFRLTAARVLRIASADPRVRAELRRHPRARPYEYTRGLPVWQVSWFSATHPQRELMQVYVNDATAKVAQVWTGFQVAWTMARGYPGAFGRDVNAWYVWLPLCALFIAPFAPWPRRAGTGRERPRLRLLHLDLAALLGFSISLALFNHARIGLSVPLVYPFLLYLLGRMLLLANGRGVSRLPLRPSVPDSWLAVGTVFLIAFRIALNVLDSNVIDVGYAGVIGADKLVHGHPLYGGWPHDNMYGDTYAPFAYYVYVPFRLIFGWSGHWDSLPAAHAAAICFDLLALAGLYLLGRRLRDHSLGLLLAYCWASYPFTLFALSSNTNDSLVAVTVIAALLVLGSAPARGAVALLAGMTKFAPFALAPLLLRGTERRPRERSAAAFVLAFAVVAFLVMLPVVLHGDLGRFWDDSVRYQSDRVTPFSVWGLWGGLGIVQHLLQGAAIALALGAALLPSRRGVVEVAALSAAILIALQLVANYWLYPYIVWFFPAVTVALLASHPTPLQASVREWEASDDAPAGLPRVGIAAS